MENINILVVFIEGILSIFSPCILPILPIYLGMLSNSSIDNIKSSSFKSNNLLKNTIFFTLGISTTFFILGSSINALSSFFSSNRNIIMIIGGVIIIFMGLFYVGIIKSNFLSQEKRLRVESKKMTPVSAFVLGFTFSFGWTPCIGPILASVLIMASGAENVLMSNLLILVYTIGFIVPFLLAAIFYSKLYKKFDKVKEYMDVIKKVSGVIIIFAGLLMLTSGITNYISKQGQYNGNNISNNNVVEDNNKEEEVKALDFSLYDQYGNEHNLSDYKGKKIFLNFWATWCPPCKKEMPDIEELYNEYNLNKDDVVILGVASPNLGREGDEQHIKDFLIEEGYTFPVVFDEGGSLVMQYGLYSFPSTFIIDEEGNIIKYVPGSMSKSTMKKIIQEVK